MAPPSDDGVRPSQYSTYGTSIRRFNNETQYLYNGRDDHFIVLKQDWATYLHLQGHISRIDEQIKKHLMEVHSETKNEFLN